MLHNTNNRCRQRKKLLLLLGFMLLIPVYALPALADQNSPEPNDWEFFGQFNLWAPSINARTVTGAEIDIGIDDIIDNLDFAFLGTLGAVKGKWTFLADVIYLNLEQSDNYSIVNNALLQLDITKIELEAWSVTPMVAYNILKSDRVSLDLLAGVRYLWLGIDTDIRMRVPGTTNQTSDSSSFDVWNGIVGVRGEIYISGKWFIPYFFDVGTGDCDYIWQAYAAVGYRLSNIDLAIGYRHSHWEFDDDGDGGDLLDELSISGPMVGIKWHF